MRLLSLPLLAALGLALWFLGAPGAVAQGCGPRDYAYDCIVEQSTYHIRIPEIADPLHRFPVVVVLHDAGGSGEALVRDERLIAGFIDKGYAILAPDALMRRNLRYLVRGRKPGLVASQMDTVRADYSDKRFLMRGADGGVRVLRFGRDTGWYFYNIDRARYSQEPSANEFIGRDEVGFIRRALRNAAKDFPIDPDPVLIVGLGHGGSLVWQIACYAPRMARLLVPVDGAFWDKVPKNCAPGANLVQTQYRKSAFWPLEGTPGSKKRFARTPIAKNLEMLLRVNRCGWEREEIRDDPAGATRTVWSDCAAGGPVELMLLDRPFAFRTTWFDSIHDRLDAFDIPQPFSTPDVPVETGPRFSQPGGKAESRFTRPGADDGSRFRKPDAGTADRFKKAK